MEVPQGAEGQDTQTSLQALIKVLAGILCPQLAIQTLKNKACMAHRDSSPEPPAPAELKDVAVTLCSEPSCCTEPPAPKQAPTCPHANSMRDRLSLREAHSAQCTPGSTLVSPCRPSPRPGPGCPSPPASPGRRVTFQVRSLATPRGRSVSASSATPPSCGSSRTQLGSPPPHRAHRAGSRLLLPPPLALRGSQGLGGRAAGRSCGDVGAAASLVCGGRCEKEARRREEGARRRGGTEEGGGQPGVAWESPEPASLKVGSPAPARTCTPETACSKGDSLHFILRTSGVRQLK